MQTPALPGFANSRDLGGIATGAGSATAAGAIVRSNTPAELTDDELRTALDYGFVRVLDLRSAAEVDSSPHPLNGSDGYRNLPLIDPRAEQYRDADAEQTLADIYRGSIVRNTSTIAEIMRAIADAPDGPILICCAAGKDRTGMISAVLLELAGASRPAIGADYARTETCMRPLFDDELAAADATSRQHRSDLQNSEADNVLGMLDHVLDRYGSVPGYLNSLGLTDEQVQWIRRRLSSGSPLRPRCGDGLQR